MSLYQCEECGCVENTAKGHYHCIGRGLFKDAVKDKLKLCSACAPIEFSDGTICEDHGKWHGLFDRSYFPKGSLFTNKEGNVAWKENGARASLGEGSSKPLKQERES